MSRKKNQNVSDRRAFLKKAAATGISGTALSLGVTASEAAIVSASSPPDPSEHWEKSDSDEIYNSWDQGLYHSSSVGWFGATWEGSREGWVHDFRISSTMSGRSTNDPDQTVPNIEEHWLGVTSGGLSTLKGEYLSEYYGATPTPDSDNYDHSDAVQAVIGDAIGELVASNPVTAFAWSAAQTLDKMANWLTDGTPDSTWTINDTWSYENLHPDASHLRWIEAGTTDESYFDIKTSSSSNLDLSCSTSYTFHLRQDYIPEEGPLSYSTTQTTKQGTTLFRPKENWLVEKIPQKKLEIRGSSLGFSNSKIDRLRQSGKPVYYAHEAPINLVE